MTNPKQIYTRMIGFVAAIIAIGLAIVDPLQKAFMANPAINGLILGVLVVGIIYVFRQVLILRPEINWINSYRRTESVLTAQKPPRLLGPMANMLGDRDGKSTKLSTLSMRSLLDGISSRLDESREIARYVTGLLIFLGLLGTFWGLLETITSVGNAIGTLKMEGSDFAGQFTTLKQGLEAPLAGMGTAFSSSLFGLGGSLVLGFLDLQAGQAQNRFYNDLEEWLSSLTHLSSASGIGDGEQSVPVYVEALLEQTADSLDNLRITVSSAESSRQSSAQSMMSLTEKLATLTDQMRSEQDLMVKLIESQMEVRPILEKLSDALQSNADKAMQTHLRNIDVYMAQLVEQTSRGQEQLIQELRSELKLLSRTIAGSLATRPRRD